MTNKKTTVKELEGRVKRLEARVKELENIRETPESFIQAFDGHLCGICGQWLKRGQSHDYRW
jgi:hypothetical protein